MRKFAGIIESTTVAPPTNYLWIKGNDALYFTNGKWVSLLTEDSADRIELETKVDDLDKEIGQIKKDLSVLVQNRMQWNWLQVILLSTTGGNALIITDKGHAVKYSIAADGEVTKLSEFTLGEHTLPKATKTTLGGIKAIINVANLAEDATIAQVAGAVNTLLGQFRNCGLIQL